MKVVVDDASIELPKTKTTFTETKTNNNTLKFTGILETYDGFTTKKLIKLNVIIVVYYCEFKKKYIPLFKMSPKGYDEESWDILNLFEISPDICVE